MASLAVGSNNFPTRVYENPPELVDWLDVQEKRNVVITFGGGVNEVMRDMIATAGLGLPRAKR